MDEQDTSRARRGDDRGRKDRGLHVWPAAPQASSCPQPGPLPGEAHPEAGQVLDLIQRAERHELGREFLMQGAPDAVAATFGVHAFLVDAARDHLAAGPKS